MSLAQKVLICIPTYNERDNVPELVKEIFKNVPDQFEILFIDDGSPDGTGQVIEQLCSSHSKVHVLHRSGKQGLASAYMVGFLWGLEKGYSWIMEMDADFSHDPIYLKDFQSLINSAKYQAISASRYISGGGVSNWSPGRVLLSKMGSLYARIWLRHPVSDFTGGFNAWSAELLRKMNLRGIQSKGYAFQIELKYRALELNAKFTETPIVFRERRHGASKMSGDIVREAIVGVVKLRCRQEQGQLFKN